MQHVGIELRDEAVRIEGAVGGGELTRIDETLRHLGHRDALAELA